MPDNEQNPAGETPAPAGGTEPQAGKDGTPFDAQRAQATIDALRNEIKAGKATAKEAETLKARLKEIEDKDKSEVERLAGSAKEASEKLVAAEARAADLALRLTVERAATKAGFHDPDDAYRLIDRRTVELDDAGEPTNVEALLKDLAKAKPHLVKAEDSGKKMADRGTPALPKPASGAPANDREQRDLEGLRATGRYAV